MKKIATGGPFFQFPRAFVRFGRPLHGFTLIELLLVISIITLLLSILIPAMQKVRELAEKAVCGSQLHQTGLATQIYANDNNGVIIGAAQGGSSGLVSANGVAEGVKGLGLIYHLWKDTDLPPEVFYCPSQKNPYPWNPSNHCAENFVHYLTDPYSLGYTYCSYVERVGYDDKNDNHCMDLGEYKQFHQISDLGGKAIISDLYDYGFARSAHPSIDAIVSASREAATGGWNVLYSDSSVEFFQIGDFQGIDLTNYQGHMWGVQFLFWEEFDRN